MSGVLVEAVEQLEQAVSPASLINPLKNGGNNRNRGAGAKPCEPGNDPLERIKRKEIYQTTKKAIYRWRMAPMDSLKKYLAVRVSAKLRINACASYGSRYVLSC